MHHTTRNAGEAAFNRWTAQAIAITRGLRVLPARPVRTTVTPQSREDTDVEALAVGLGILAPHPGAPGRPTAVGGTR